MKLSNYLFIILSVLISTVLTAQQDTLLRQFYTQRMQARIEQNEVVLENRSVLERQMEVSKRNNLFKQMTVPVVFHVLYAPGQAYPQGEQIAKQLKALNRDFSSLENDTKHPKKDTLLETQVVDTEIEFCLPAKNPDGKKTSGVNYVPVSVDTWSDNDDMKSELTGGASPWPPDQFLNVWVVHLLDSISGWAQMPGGPLGTDGIVVDYRYFGTGGTAIFPYNEGKTLTHLIGNYLNLYDLWDEKNSCGDDHVEDTPIHNGPNYRCYEDENHVSLCNDGPTEMVTNFMDNTPDACMYRFTEGQKSRMQATLLEGGPRSGLIATSVKCGKLPKATAIAVDTNALTDVTQSPEDDEGGSPFIEPTVNIYPNPATDIATLTITVASEGQATVTVYDALGRVVLHNASINVMEGNQRQELPIVNWPSGTYYVHVVVNDYQFNERFVVNRTKQQQPAAKATIK